MQETNRLKLGVLDNPRSLNHFRRDLQQALHRNSSQTLQHSSTHLHWSSSLVRWPIKCSSQVPRPECNLATSGCGRFRTISAWQRFADSSETRQEKSCSIHVSDSDLSKAVSSKLHTAIQLILVQYSDKFMHSIVFYSIVLRRSQLYCIVNLLLSGYNTIQCYA